jgi:hypothetical protein
MDDLALEVGVVNDVEINEAEISNASGGEVERKGRTKASSADAEDACILQTLLAFGAKFGEREMARIAEELGLGEVRIHCVAQATSRSFVGLTPSSG